MKQLMLYLVAVCLLPTAAYGGERTEQRWPYQHGDGEWFKCKGEVCDQPIPPPAWASTSEHERSWCDCDQFKD
jgi:hypothetical protein